LIFPPESGAMRFFRSIGMEGIGWSLRRLHCPVPKDALVLDVGSGGNPYPRANVLLDAYEDTVERYHAPLIKDRPIVYGMAERMPFRDQAFDFVIASHVLEHSTDPSAFLSELMRVGKAGYIETPDAFIERINPFRFHRLEVTDRDKKIVIYKKPSWRPNNELVDLYEHKLKDGQFISYMKRHPVPFYMRFYWDREIAFEIVNPEVDISWPIPTDIFTNTGNTGDLKQSARRSFVRILRSLFSQNRRNRTIDLLGLLRCPSCGSNVVVHESDSISCRKCSAVYSCSQGIPVMYPEGHFSRK